MDAIALKRAESLEGPDKLRTRKYRAASRSAETKRAIRKGWRAFAGWCQERGIRDFPCTPETLEAYLVALAESGKKTATIEQAKYAVDARHQLSGVDAPGASRVVKIALAGIRRTLGVRQRRTAALTLDHVRAIQFQNDLKGLRDRALLMTAVCGGFRRSELSALQVQDVEETAHGLRVLLSRSKSDQEGAGVFVDIVKSNGAPRLCPVVALKNWLIAADIQAGPLFPSMKRWNRIGTRPIPPENIALLVKWAAAQCGLDPREFSGHSPRAGCATFLLDRGVALNVVANHLRHKSINTTRRYDRNATARALVGVY